jgi:TolB-like protein/cytochrome c-type biogenesis protein CcmH/NrfG
MSQPSPVTGGVFISYAREDTEPARRIADALRAFGVEVWFDQNELRGGDTWDAKIKKQIRECSLFIALISANTQARGEGYFRREWRMAVERTHDMAAGMSFLLPVVVDDTHEADALVPEELLRVQWTQLQRGVPTSEFVEQVKRLLGGAKSPARESRPGPRPQPRAAPPAKPIWIWPILGVVAVAAAVAAYLALRQPTATSAAKPPAGAMPAAAATAVAANDKSVAVLPFTNMSDEKDNAFFTDGIHEDILTNLAQIHDLRVVSRTSVMQYKGTTKSIREIAAELGVAYILEGSVRRAGGKVRVTGQLIHAATDEHVWAKAYDRDLTDIFAIQGQLAEAIAAALKTQLSPDEKAKISRRPTENPVAYDFYLRARDVWNREGVSPAIVAKRTALLASAVKEDPNFALAWGELADVYAFGVFLGATENALLADAKSAIEKAQQLAPDDPAVIQCVGTYYYYAFRDYARANEKYEQLAQQRPNDPTLFNSLGLIQRRQGAWAQSLANTRRSVELDPANIMYLRNLEETLLAGNHWDEAVVIQRRIVALLPDLVVEGYILAQIPFNARGSTAEAEAYFKHLPPDQANSPAALDARRDWAMTVGNLPEAKRFDRMQRYYAGLLFTPLQADVLFAVFLDYHGEHAAALERMGTAVAQLREKLRQEPGNARNWLTLSHAELIAGHPDEALRCADRAVQAMPESRDALDGPVIAYVRARLYDLAGQKEVALKEYARLLRVPQGANVYALKVGMSTLHGDPRFEALINDPANNAPLF